MPRPPQTLAKRDYSTELAALGRLFSGKQRGDLITHAEIEQATKLKQNVSPWNTVLNKFRRGYLRDIGIALRSEKNVGYRLLTVQQQIEDDHHRRRARRALQRDFSEKVFIKDNELDQAQQRLVGALAHQTAKGIQTLQTHAVERKSFLASPDTVNRYCQTNAIRPRAVLVEEVDDAEAREQELREPPPPQGSGGTTP
jgi:hypothetical protein